MEIRSRRRTPYAGLADERLAADEAATKECSVSIARSEYQVIDANYRPLTVGPLPRDQATVSHPKWRKVSHGRARRGDQGRERAARRHAGDLFVVLRSMQPCDGRKTCAAAERSRLLLGDASKRR